MPSTPDVLWDAAQQGYLTIIQECIDNGVDKEAKDGTGQTALHLACWHGHLEVVKYLIETCGVDMEARTNS